eukprot:1960228-Rhodomonas_salina.2
MRPSSKQCGGVGWGYGTGPQTRCVSARGESVLCLFPGSKLGSDTEIAPTCCYARSFPRFGIMLFTDNSVCTARIFRDSSLSHRGSRYNPDVAHHFTAVLLTLRPLPGLYQNCVARYPGSTRS